MPHNLVTRALDILEDTTITQGLLRQQNLEVIKNVLDKEVNLDLTIVERILAICVHDLKNDMKQSVFCLNIIAAILKRLKAARPTLDLLPAAEAVVNILQTSAILNKAESLQTMAFHTLLAFPDDVLIALACMCQDMWEIFNLYCHQKIILELRLQPIILASKLLKILSPLQKTIFVKNGVAVWFSKVIPCVMKFYQTEIIAPSVVLTSLEVLEMLTEELVKIDYANNAQWQNVLEYIYSPNLYPAAMKNLLSSGSEHWHRLWIVFIKLLKTQITMNKPGVGSPINSMLPVVEMAFKMDVTNRCRAFQCWKVLIDNFSAETNELFVNKRIKLLIIPLRSNNAKVEETALAKLDTWWHLIKQYEARLDDRILYPFLHFCFGRHIPEKTSLIPGLISPKVKKNCVKAFVELVGHVNCDGCGLEVRLKNKVISAKVLVNHWNDWVHSLKTAIKISAEDDVALGKEPIICAWKSFAMTIAELPENNIRKDLFEDMLIMIKELAQECQNNSKLADIVINVLITSLFQYDTIKPLLLLKETQNGPVHQIISILINPTLEEVYRSANYEELLKILKLITGLVSNESPNLMKHYLEWLMEYLPVNDCTLHLWAALTESLRIMKWKNDTLICNFLLWPLQHWNNFSNVDVAALTWCTTYTLMALSLNNTPMDKEATRIVLENENRSPAVTYFRLCVLVAIIKAKIIALKFDELDKLVNVLLDVTCEYNHYKEFKRVFPILIDTLHLMASSTESICKYLERIVLIMRRILKLLNKELKQNNTFESEMKILNVMNAIQPLFKTQDGIEFKVLIVDELLECRSLCTQSVHLSLDLILNAIISDEAVDPTLRAKIKTALMVSEVNSKSHSEAENTADSKSNDPTACEFSTPVPKSVKKRNTKKKEASIVNTVIENGEEFAVIQSNWKFNPKKLTENQKEKFQRKREDIPALYQDLSQSQDEFKLKSWKTDSQDTSTSNSRSASVPSNEDVSTVLKSMPGTNIVPKIIDQFFSDSVKSDSVDITQNEKTDSPKSKKDEITKSSSSIKTPRMALKDRVFRNVRNLIEKSTLSKEVTNKPDLLNETVSASVFNTPVTKIKETKNNVYSAPSKISVDRPARIKRTPKKFDDTKIYLLKKRKKSMNYDESLSPEIAQCSEDLTAPLETDRQIVEPPNFAKVAVEKNQSTTLAIESPSFTDACVKRINLDNTETSLLKKRRKSVSQNYSQSLEMAHSTENINIPSETDTQNDIELCKTAEVLGKKKSDEDPKTTASITESQVVTKINTCDQNSAEQLGNQVMEAPPPPVKETTDKKGDEENPKPDGEINISSDVSYETTIEEQVIQDESESQTSEEKSTPKQIIKKKYTHEVKSSSKKKMLVEKQLAIDTVEGHPFLKLQTDKRITRKCLAYSPNSTRRKSLTEKLNIKSKTDRKSASKSKRNTNNKELLKEKSCKIAKGLSITVCATQDTSPDATQDLSQDIIESSQDSTTTIPVKLFKSSSKNSLSIEEKENTVDETQNLIDNITQDINITADVLMTQDKKDDTELPANKTDCQENITNLTDEMDTEPTDAKCASSDEVVVINDEDDPVIVINTEDMLPGPDTLELANADTQPTDLSQFAINPNLTILTNQNDTLSRNDDPLEESKCNDSQMPSAADDRTLTLSDITQHDETGNASSPAKDDEQRKKDFLNNTLEISPIKSLSPIEPKSPSPETSSDFLVVKLSGPVQMNGEPMEMSSSLEIFTEEIISPEKRDQSPPRVDVAVRNSSPSSSLSLKKNRPQVRSGGRAAQMLGLCVPDGLQSIMNIERPETDESKKNSPVNIPARRNLRMLYNTTNENDISDENEESEHFLKFKRSVPTADCSPSGPILKRKLADISDETTISPANKRKRVSFHDPVSTSVSVRKYIESSGIRSPQNSALKRLERQMRSNSHMKSPKRLENSFKLDSMLTKAIESFTDSDLLSNDTQLSSLEQTPSVEVVKTFELNDTDPIFSDLIDCQDSIHNIATELSSPAMGLLLVKELEGNIETVGDLAKLSELEVNRLCIKAPKIQVVKKVLGDYASKKSKLFCMKKPIMPTMEIESAAVTCNIEVQTTVSTSETETQTSIVLQRLSSTQTDEIMTTHKTAQTDESGSQSTEDIIKSCLRDRKDFVQRLDEHLDDADKRKLAESLPVKDCLDFVLNKMCSSDANVVLNRVIRRESELHSNGQSGNKELSFLLNYLSEKFDAKDLILFCSQMLQKVYDNSV